VIGAALIVGETDAATFIASCRFCGIHTAARLRVCYIPEMVVHQVVERRRAQREPAWSEMEGRHPGRRKSACRERLKWPGF
jgi:hypothetical protein